MGSWEAGSKRSSPRQEGEQAKGRAPTLEMKPGGMTPFLTHLLPTLPQIFDNSTSETDFFFTSL